jgi:transglutaminase-like putative cysteine protease
LLVLMRLHPSRDATVLVPECLHVEPIAPIYLFTDHFGNRCGRICVGPGRTTFRNRAVVRDCGLPDIQEPLARQSLIQELPDSVLVFLLSSRYCEVDSELREIAWQLFSWTEPGWPRVQAVCEFVHRHIHFDYMQARATRTAVETFRERVGVCRDYTHLAITFCRCLNIPARYCTGYLGDIGIPVQDSPMDFSAWMEVYIGRQWYTFDARNLTPRIGRVLMARGRDATDAALITCFGASRLETFSVRTDEISDSDLCGFSGAS